MAASHPRLPYIIGRYALYGEIAAGGMATVHYGRLLGPVGFSRTVAIKRLHPQFARDPEFVSMFLDEARLAGRVRHPNVVQTLDVVALDGELFLVMDYVQGESLGRLVGASRAMKQSVPLPVVSAILAGALQGLHAAHEATNERGEPLHIVHRDVSPQNILVGVDGVPRVLDFGVAKATGRVHTTREGQVKGKLAYMAPETLLGRCIDRRADVYAAGVVLWEALTLQRLFTGDSEGAVVGAVLNSTIAPPSSFDPAVPRPLDELTMRALDRDPGKRFESARQMALALEACVPIASATRLTGWVEGLAGEILAQRAKALAQIESDSGPSSAPMRSSATTAVAEPRPSARPDDTVARGVDELLTLPSRVSGRRRIGVAAGVVGAALPACVVVLSLCRPVPARHGESVVVEPAPAAPTPAPTATPIASVVASEAPSADAAVLTATHPAPVSTRGRPRVPPRIASTPPQASSAQPCTIRSFVDDQGITHFVKDCP